MTLELIGNPSLSDLTTLGLGSTAAVMAVVRSEADLDELTEFLGSNPLVPFVIGNGSNILAPDRPLDMALIRLDLCNGPDRVEQQGDRLLVRVDAGRRLPGLLGWAQKAGLTGLEGLTGIPGTVGGAVAMNAGSYGTQFGDHIARVQLWTPETGLIWVDADQCRFGYRSFSTDACPGKCLVWAVELSLEISTPKAVRKGMRSTYEKKKQTQPVTARSAGCVFKNPDGQSAGKLMDQAGLKGARLGGMSFSEIHANFLVNLGAGTSSEAMELLELARSMVLEKFQITLETEVIIL